VKPIAQMGAAIGREFTHELLASVASMPEPELSDALDRLVESELVLRRGAPPDAVYTFKHALVQDAAHSSLLKSQRQAFHARIVNALERQQPQLLEAQPEILAQHCTEAGLLDRAVELWHLAGARSVARSAHREAIRQFGRALELIPGLPAGTARDEREVDLRLALAVPLIAVHGFGSAAVEDCAKRAKAVSGFIDQRHRFAVHRLEWNSCLLRQPMPRTVTLAEGLMSLAREARAPAELAVAHRALAYSLHMAGALPRAAQLFAEGIALANDVADDEFLLYGEHPGMVCRTYGGQVDCLMGFPDRAVRLVEAAITHARARKSPHALAWALVTAGDVHTHRRDATSARRLATEAIALSHEHHLPQWAAFSHAIAGRAACECGEWRHGIALVEQGLRQLHATGAVLHTTRLRVWLAEAHVAIGDIPAARAQLVAANEHRAAHDENYYWPELCRAEGSLAAAEGACEVAESALLRACQIARDQSARLWELRAATSLARLWSEQGKHSEARDLLGSTYGWFTEGFSTSDLKKAKALLDELT
jgi:tetratricopeptide (TPR) repeat protein